MTQSMPAIVHQCVLQNLRSRFTPRDQHRVGMEVEHLCIRKLDGQRIGYDDSPGCVLDVFRVLHRLLGGTTVEAEGLWLELRGDWGKVTLEPGNQIEWSSPARLTCDELINDLHHWLAAFNTALQDNALMSLPTGLDSTEITQVPWLSKQRYRLMRQYYSDNAAIAHRAMFNTAGVHVNFDYADARDWQRKFRVLLLASPAAIALFANSAGDLRGQSYAALRPVLWLETDLQRTKLPSNAFDDDYAIDRWADWVAERPQLFRQEGDQLQLADDEPLVSVAANTDDPVGNNSPSDKRTGEIPDLERAVDLQLSSLFTPVRSAGQLEVRTIDTQADDRLAATVAFWTGLIYHPSTLQNALHRLTESRADSNWNNLFYRACRFGMTDPELAGLAEDLRQMATDGLTAIEGRNSNGVAAIKTLEPQLSEI